MPFLLWYALRNKQSIYIHENNKATNVNMCGKKTPCYIPLLSSQDANEITDIRGSFRIASIKYFILAFTMNSKM